MATPIERRAEITTRRARVRDHQTILFAAPGLAVALFGLAFLTYGIGARAAETPALSLTPTSVTEVTRVRPQREFSVATPIPMISEIVALNCQGLTAFSDADQGALTRKGPGRQFEVEGPGIPAGSPVDLGLVVQVTLPDGTKEFHALTEYASSSSLDGTTTTYSEVAHPNVKRAGLGVNADLPTSCMQVIEESKP